MCIRDRTLNDAFAKLKGAVVPHLVSEAGRHTTRKVRFVSEHHSAHLMRADWETAQPASAESEAAVIAQAEAALPQCLSLIHISSLNIRRGGSRRRLRRRRHGRSPIAID